MNKLLSFTTVCVMADLLFSLDSLHAQQGKAKGLNDYYQQYFTIGVAVSPQALKN